MEIEKSCLYCAKKTNGRTDKKFCNNYCRSSFHNEQSGQLTNYMRRVNAQLVRNRNILASLLQSTKCKKTIDFKDLFLLGFHPNHCTHQTTSPNNITSIYCYDYGYQLLKANKVLLLGKEG